MHNFDLSKRFLTQNSSLFNIFKITFIVLKKKIRKIAKIFFIVSLERETLIVSLAQISNSIELHSLFHNLNQLLLKFF